MSRIKRVKKKNNKKIMYFILLVVLFIPIALMCGFFGYVYFNAPEFRTELLYKEESSNIYDSDKNLIATIGTEKRQLIKYSDLPEVFIDALIATEDARFFEHEGLDLPRFLKASVGYINGQDAGGASTLTMQVSKNTFTSVEAEGFDGVVRKFTDIYLSIFKIERDYTKEEIIEFYINSPYLGAGSYGVEQAAETYFGKSIKDINLVEAAMLVGLFQAPGKYDPYVNPDKATNRKNEVINLMLRHKYITSDEAETAKKVNAEDIVKEQNNNINPYQGFIDTVVQEVIDKTGNNPYEVSMDIYSTMIKEKQDVINNFYKKWKFKDKKVQVGIGVIDNNTGEIIAVGAGRNKTSEMSLNYATQIKRHPGSTAKPIFDYGPGIEYKNWSTYTPFVDKPVSYTSGGIMKNFDNTYRGFLTMQQCLVLSINTCALKAFQSISNSKIDKFATSLGITPEYLSDTNRYINEAHSIGGFTGVSPVQLAASYAAFGNGGYYTEPHSVTRIVYKTDTKKDEVYFNYEKSQVMKDTTAYMISYMLKNVTSSTIKVKGTDIATKTGTSSYDYDTLRKLGLSNKVIQDSWTVTYSPDYSIAIWYGYDKLSKKTYNTSTQAWSERLKIQRRIVTKTLEENSKFKRPSGLVTAQVVVGTNPPLLPNGGTPSSKIQTHLFIKGTQPTDVIAYSDPKPETPTEENNNSIDIPNILEP